jgi:hypothetical protein
MIARLSLAILAIPWAIGGCSPDPRDLQIMQEAKSPDGALTAAYVLDTGGGAAVGTGQDVYVFRGHGPTRYSDRVFSDECVDDVRIRWLGLRELQISYGTRGGNKPTGTTGPWWNFGRVPYGLTLRLVPHDTNGTYC